MGEQALSQAQRPAHSQSPTDPVAAAAVTTQPQPPSSTSAASTTIVDAPSVPLPASSQSHLSKIPSRPRKIRKVSPEETDANSSPQTTAIVVADPPKSADRTTKTAKLQQQRSATVFPRVVSRSLSCDGEIEAAIRHLRNADPVLASLIDVHPPPAFDTFQTPFLALTRSILYQQLAFKAGTSIYTRFISLCGGEQGVLPETVLSLTPQQLRQIGISGRKASYLHDLSRKYQNGILSDAAIVNMDDKSLFTMLTMVSGIGSWSVHMFMIFSLHRPDVLPINDLGVRKGVQLLYNLEELPRPSQMDQLCEKWRPYRSVASWYLWRLVEAKGAPSSAAAVAAGVSLPPPPRQDGQQPQLLDPINSILNLGACAWGQ